MGKAAGKRGSVAPPPSVEVPPKKADPGLQSLMDYGDNLEVSSSKSFVPFLRKRKPYMPLYITVPVLLYTYSLSNSRRPVVQLLLNLEYCIFEYFLSRAYDLLWTRKPTTASHKKGISSNVRNHVDVSSISAPLVSYRIPFVSVLRIDNLLLLSSFHVM